MSSTQKLALVTGASSGIGAMYADRLAARGYNLLIVARRHERLQQLAEQLKQRYAVDVDILVADLAQSAQVTEVESYIQKHPELEMLVNCAGLGALGAIQALDPLRIEQMLSVNIMALTRLTLAAAQSFRLSQRGNIINIGSVVAAMPVAGAGGYSGSKAYVLNFSRALHAELKDQGVNVQVVMPGPVRSEFFDGHAAPFPDALFMDADVLVDCALNGFDRGEMICYPNLHDLNAWQDYENARGVMVKAVTQTGQAAARYLSSDV